MSVPLSAVGSGLVRPESVVAHQSGYLFCASWRDAGGISIISPSGVTTDHLSRERAFCVKPNGIALEPGGSFLLAHLGQDDGGLYRLATDGQLTPVLTHVDGHSLPPANFPLLDARGRIWLSVSTRLSPRALDYRQHAASGFIVLIDKGHARIVADGLGYTNEMVFSPDGRYLYVNETFGRRLSRFTVSERGELSDRQIVARFEAGDYPDGLTLDSEGNFLITSIVSNRVIRLSRDGQRREVLMQGSTQQHIDWVEAAYNTDTMAREHLDRVQSETLKNISSLAFGGTDLCTAYLGCLLGESLMHFQYPLPGLRPLHYGANIQPLLAQYGLSPA